MDKVRGYIFSRPFMGERVPQHVQNLVIRDYCQKHELQYLLSAVEYAMLESHLVIEQVLDELLKSIDGIVMYSIFQLPEKRKQRNQIYNRILESKGILHLAVEGLQIENERQKDRLEEIWLVRQSLPHSLTFKEN